MMPWKSQKPLTSSVVEVFNGLTGEAREKAIATGNYDKLINEKPREPGQDDEWMDDSLASQA